MSLKAFQDSRKQIVTIFLTFRIHFPNTKDTSNYKKLKYVRAVKICHNFKVFGKVSENVDTNA